MAAIMRLKRMGRRNRPFFRVVVADSRHPRDGRFIEELGHYDPLKDPAEVEIDEGKVLKWLGEGIELSDTVRSILKREGLLKKWHDASVGEEKSEEKKTAAPPAEEAEVATATKKKEKSTEK